MTDLLSQLKRAPEGRDKGLRYEIGKQITAEAAARYEAIYGRPAIIKAHESSKAEVA